MRARVLFSIAAVAPFVLACGGGPGGGSAAPAALAFDVAAERTVSYAQSDTAVISVDAGGQMIDIQALSESVMDMTFTPSERGVQVSATWRELDATVSNPMGPAERVTADDVEGPVVFNMDRRGAANLVSTPTYRGSAGNMLSSSEVVHGFFPRLPGTPPTPGMTWTDTIAYEADEVAGPLTARTVMTYTVAGDTVVDGRTLLKVELYGSDTRTQEGVTSGMAFVQTTDGTLSGHFLWDLEQGMLHSQLTYADFTGTMDVDAVPFPLDVAMRAVSHVSPAGS